MMYLEDEEFTGGCVIFDGLKLIVHNHPMEEDSKVSVQKILHGQQYHNTTLHYAFT